jgi:hypothetical protein
LAYIDSGDYPSRSLGDGYLRRKMSLEEKEKTKRGCLHKKKPRRGKRKWREDLPKELHPG